MEAGHNSSWIYGRLNFNTFSILAPSIHILFFFSFGLIAFTSLFILIGLLLKSLCSEAYHIQSIASYHEFQPTKGRKEQKILRNSTQLLKIRKSSGKGHHSQMRCSKAKIFNSRASIILQLNHNTRHDMTSEIKQGFYHPNS